MADWKSVHLAEQDEKIADIARRLAECEDAVESERELYGTQLKQMLSRAEAAEARVRELEAQARTERRWETGFRNIVTRTLGPCAPFDIPQIMDMVEHLWWLKEVAQFREVCSFGGPWADDASDELDAIWKDALAATEVK